MFISKFVKHFISVRAVGVRPLPFLFVLFHSSATVLPEADQRENCCGHFAKRTPTPPVLHFILCCVEIFPPESVFIHFIHAPFASSLCSPCSLALCAALAIILYAGCPAGIVMPSIESSLVPSLSTWVIFIASFILFTSYMPPDRYQYG